ncbi:hypothetical protein [uncultured Enterovirga sp.]|uniref:hypothetical protein n=1 Tax=uncultured Enterovirga sp. TaxID=2026352 RepID=UPI0035CBB187
MQEPVDIILPLLRDMRAENASRHAEVVARLEKLEASQVSFKHALSADSLLSKLVTGDFHERIEAVERWVQEQEERAS